MKRITACLLVICMIVLCFGTISAVFGEVISDETELFKEDFSGTLSNWVCAADSNPAIDKNIPETLGGSNTTDVLWAWGNASFGYNLAKPVTDGKVVFEFDIDPNKMANYEGEVSERAFSVYVGGENVTASNVSGIPSISSKLGAMRIFKPANTTAAEFRRGWESDFVATSSVAVTEAGYHRFKIVVDMDTRKVNTYLDGTMWGDGYTMPITFTSVNSLMFTGYLNLAAVFLDNVSIKHITSIDTGNLVADVRWDFIVDEENFYEQPNTGASIDGVTDGILKLSTTGDDPYIRLDYMKNDYGITLKPGSGHKYMKIRMKNNSNSTESTMMLVPEKQDGSTDYTGKPAPDWANAYNIKFYPSANDTEFKEYTIPLAAPENGKPTEYGGVFRFDFLNGVTDGSVEVDYIVFTANATPPDDGRMTGICFESNDESLSDVAVEGFESDKEYYEADVYRDVYERLSSETVKVSFSDALPTPTVTVTVKDLVTRKCVDVIASDTENGYLRSYRIVCRAIKRPAKDTEIVVKNFSIKDKVLTFSGNLTNGETQPISLLAYKSGDDKEPQNLKVLKVFTPGDDGSFEGIINIYDDETAQRYYTMELCFDVAGEDATVTKSAVYFNTTKKKASVDEMSRNTDGVLEFMSTDENRAIYENMGVWLDKYSENTALKSAMNESTKKHQGTVTVENVIEIANVTIATFIANGGSEEEIRTLLERIDADVKSLEVAGTRFGKMNDKSKEWVVENFVKNKPQEGYADYLDFCLAVQKSMLLEIVNRTKYTELCDLLLKNTTILGDGLTELKNETNTDVIDAAMRKLVKKADESEFVTTESLVAAVPTALTDAKSEVGGSNGGNGNGGSGGGGGGGSVGNTPVTEPFVSSPDMNSEYIGGDVFDDLKDYDWAADAITKLYEKGIVNGVSQNRFEPGREVTREEFVKLICEAFNFGKSYSATAFSDVDDNEWYAPYVARATELGIIKGVSDELFGSGEKITREDMAAIIYRVLTAKGKVLSVDGMEFADSDIISDYAVEAVKQLSGAEIINGVGNGNFAPRTFATRAEASVIIFRCIETFSF